MPAALFTRKKSVALTNSLATTPVINVEDVGEFILHAPGTYTTSTLTFYVYNPVTMDYQELTADDGTALSRSLVQAKSVRGPEESFAAESIKIVTNQAGNNDRVVGITFKGAR
jgi:hypothetical protein